MKPLMFPLSVLMALPVLLLGTRDIWAAILAHCVTNFLLGLYVLLTSSYQFW